MYPDLHTAMPDTRHLAAQQVHRLTLHAGDVVLVCSGVLWLTQAGDAADHLLDAGSAWQAAPPHRPLRWGPFDRFNRLKRPIVIQAVSGPASWTLLRHRPA